MSLEKLAKTVERAEAALSQKELLDEVLAGLYGGQGLALFSKCLRERKCAAGGRVSDGNLRMLFVNSGL